MGSDGRVLERLSIEVTNRCSKGCAFCYNQSSLAGQTAWTVDDLLALCRDAAANGLRAVSFGGGEPLEFEGIFDVLTGLGGVLFRSLTTNGLPLLDGAVWRRLLEARPDKVHLSIHEPERAREVARVIAQVRALADAGIPSGVNLLVGARTVAGAARAAAALADAGIGRERVVFLPMRIEGEPTPEQVAQVAAALPGAPATRFQSTSCLTRCGSSPRFCSIRWDREVAWCSYTATRRPLAAPTFAALLQALDGLGLRYCGTTPHLTRTTHDDELAQSA